MTNPKLVVIWRLGVRINYDPKDEINFEEYDYSIAEQSKSHRIRSRHATLLKLE